MSAEAVHEPIHVGQAQASPLSRLYGFGSVYAKTVRDSRLAILVMAAVMVMIQLGAGAQYGRGYPTAQSRAEFANLVTHFPAVLAGAYGDPWPAHLATLGGMISLKNAAAIAVVAGFWSIIALSGTLAAEARRGSLDFVAVTAPGLRRVAVEKLAAHATAMALMLVVLAVISWLAGSLFGSLPGDSISLAAAAAFALWVGLMALASGSVAFVLAPLIGRAPAAGIAGAVLLVGDFLNGYRVAVPAFAGVANATWFGWTAHNQPLAGQYDWPSLLPVALVAVVLLAIGVEVFVRRDLGATVSMARLPIPAVTVGLGGPVGRSLGERLPLALAWGAGIGLFAMGVAAATTSVSQALSSGSTGSVTLFKALFPKIDLTTAGGFLHLAFMELGYILVGIAVVTLIVGWASDEGDGRLEELLATPVSRARWALSAGLGVMAAIAVMTAVIAAGIGIGALSVGSDARTPILGTLVLGLYAAGLAGVGLAIGGLFRPAIAGPGVAVVVTVTTFLALFAAGLKLPDWVQKLDLTSHLGQPMIGSWDWTGLAICAGLVLAGLALSAWGITRRDISR